MKRDIYELIEKMIDKSVRGADTYINKGSRWLIFTDKKKWIFEVTNEGTLWYNYYFFQKLFKLISLDLVENQHHITKWVENFIQNGVKNTSAGSLKDETTLEDTIKNGVKETKHNPFEDGLAMEEAIQNGIKVTIDQWNQNCPSVKDVLEKGVKHTEYGDWLDGDERFDDIIKNGVKETKQEEHHRLREVVQTVKNGIKETKYCELHSLMKADHIIRDGVKETWGYTQQPQIRVNEVINKGEKTIWNNDTTEL